MKTSFRTTTALFALCSTFLNGQITFADRTYFLPTINISSGNAIGVADMNNDGKDDIVHAMNNMIQYVDFQTSPNDTFTELSSPSAAIGSPWGMCIGDFNNDGYNDVFWGDGGIGISYMLHWNGTNYTSTNVNGVTGAPPDFPQGCNYFDINNDSYLDGFQCNDNITSYIYQGNGTPNGWVGAQALLPLNTVPSSDNSGNYASIWSDINNDGYMDMMITHCRQGVTPVTDPRRIDQIFINNGNGTFTQDVTNWTGLRDGAQGWSTAWGDIDNDGDEDGFVLNYDMPGHLWINNGNGTFTDSMSTCGMIATNSYFGENATFHDFDNDGFLDLLISGSTYFLYRNNGDYTFTPVTTPFPFFNHNITAHAVGDLNSDGLLDVFASYCDIYQSPSSYHDILWMNTTSTANHYVVFDLVGGAATGFSNRNGIGAIVKIYGPWGVQTREVRSGEGYGIQNSFAAHFGMGANTSIDSTVILWPSGIVDRPTIVPVDAHTTVNEGAFATAAGESYYHPLRMTFGPNPMGEQLTVNLYNADSYGLENLSVEIVDLNGKVVYANENLPGNSFTIDRNGMAGGMYIFSVQAGEKTIVSEKLILQ